MVLKLIACEVFTREACHCVARTSHVVDVEFVQKGLHDKPEVLRQVLQRKIDECEKGDKAYEAILLGFGLCGNATIGLAARSIPLVIPRAHDCCTLFLGSKAAFKEHFGHRPSAGFTSAGYHERGGSLVREVSDMRKLMGMDRTYEDYVRQYGEENAKYIWETLHPMREIVKKGGLVIYIEVPETRHLGYAAVCRAQAESDGKEFLELRGDIRLVQELIAGGWGEDEFLVVKPGERIAGVYDWDQVLKVAGAES
jgi:hypothetical protein